MLGTGPRSLTVAVQPDLSARALWDLWRLRLWRAEYPAVAFGIALLLNARVLGGLAPRLLGFELARGERLQGGAPTELRGADLPLESRVAFEFVVGPLVVAHARLDWLSVYFSGTMQRRAWQNCVCSGR
jgi:hypothetical protein